jgi:hypothetical protein
VTPESNPPLLRVRNWDARHENNRSRDLKRTDWFPAPNDLSADSYVELVGHQHGTAHLGVWYAVLMVASRARPRRGMLIKDDGRPHNSESLGRVTRLPEALIQDALTRLLQIGLLEIVQDGPPEISDLPSHPPAGNPQDPARKPQEGAVEGKGTEHHHQEGNGKERKGPERAGDEIKTECSLAGSDTQPFLRTVDDEENPPEAYASPEDELKAIYQAKAGTPITIEVLSAIRENLELTAVDMGEFVAAVKESHIRSEWRTPAGFLRDFSKRFRSKTRVAGRPITAAEAEARDYQCKICYSKTPGEGILQGDNGTFKPCSCASPEYIARQRERGVLPPETTQ